MLKWQLPWPRHSYSPAPPASHWALVGTIFLFADRYACTLMSAATATTTLSAAGLSSPWHLSLARARGSTSKPAPSKTALPTLPPIGSSCGPVTATQHDSCSSTSIARLTAAPGAPCARGKTKFHVVPPFAIPGGLAGKGASTHQYSLIERGHTRSSMGFPSPWRWELPWVPPSRPSWAP